MYYYGGNLEARGGSGREMNGYGIIGNIYLSWSSTSDRFFCDRHNDCNSITIEANKFFVDEENTIHSRTNVGNIADHILYPLTGWHQNGNVYTISDANGWNAFCEALQDNETYNRFSGKTVKLGADIGTAQDPITRMAGGSGHDMKGTFDGQGYTLTIKYGTAESPITDPKAAPFVNVESGCIIENLHVAGDIYTSGKNAAGIAGTQYGAVTIRNCRVSTAIHSYTIGDGTHGGLVGNNGDGTGSALSIEGCVFDGKLLTEGETATNKCGGFVGWRHSEVTISNSLFAPTEVTIGTTSSATFARNGATITNCYYTTDFNDGEHFTAQGKQAHSISGGDNVTVENAEAATTYSTSGITSYGTGILYDNVLYAGNGDVVSLTLSNSIGDDVPVGYQYAYSTNAGTLEGSTLTMPDAEVIVSTALRSTGQPVLIEYYTDYSFIETEAIALDGTESSLGNGRDTWYFVGTDISYSGTILCSGNVNIILVDGKTMTITSNADVSIYVKVSLTIYGQGYGTGTLNANGHTGIYSFGNIAISGGTVNATGYNNGINSEGDITISGGRVTATGSSYGIYSGGNITLGWTRPTDYIYANKYYVGGTLSIADGKTFKDVDGNPYSDTIDQVDGAYPIDGKRLYPDCVAMKHITGYGNSTESDHWVFIASPVGENIAPSEVHNLLGQKISTDPEPALYDFDFYRFNQSADLEWQNYHQHNADATNPFNTLVNGQGYLYATKEDRTLVFSGEYPSGTYSVEVSLDYDPDADLAGWNLVGNPFAVGAISSQPYYRMNAEGTALKTETETTAVAAMEGVFVQATGNDQTVTFTAQTRGGEKSAVAALNICLSKVVEPVETPVNRGDGPSTSSGTSILDNAILRFDGGQTLEKFSFREGSTKIYLPQGGKDYAIACAEGQGEMPLNFKAKENGEYTITVNPAFYTTASSVGLTYTGTVPNGYVIVFNVESGESSSISGNTLTIGDDVVEVSATRQRVPVADSWLADGIRATSFNTTGTNSITITSAAELGLLAYNVNFGGETYEGDTITLNTGIVLTGHTWEPIGYGLGDVGGSYSGGVVVPGGGSSSASGFLGTFDGAGKPILYMNTTYEMNVGLFAILPEGATVKNLTITNATVKGKGYVGAVAGQCNGTITNCHVKNSSVKFTDDDMGMYIGGIAGLCTAGTISGCTVISSSINAASVSDAQYIGGIVGMIASGMDYVNEIAIPATLKDNLFTSDMSINNGARFVGAIAGMNRDYSECNDITNNYYIGGTIGGINNTDTNGEAMRGYAHVTLPDGIGTVGSTYTPNGITVYTNGLYYDGYYYTTIIPTLTREVTGHNGDNNTGWVFIASPLVEDVTPTQANGLLGDVISGTNPVQYDFDLYRFNQSGANGEWQNYHQHYQVQDNPFNALLNGQGYLYATKETKILSFSGTFNTAQTQDVELAYDDTADLTGWNLVGNPFPVAATINKSFYVINGLNVVANTSGSVVIEPCTGVMVQADDEDDIVTFTRTNTQSQASQPNNSSLQISLSQTMTNERGASATQIDNAIVSFNEGSELGKFYFGSQNANIYIPQNDKEYAIVNAESQGEMPVCFKTNQNGTYTLNISSDEVAFNYLHLIDNLTGNDVDLLQTSSYTFEGRTTDYTSRFKLVFSANGEDGPSTGSGTFAYISNGEIIINGVADACNTSLQVIDMMGRVIVSGDAINRVSTSGMTAGVYVLRLINGNDVKTQKIVIE